MTLLLHCETVHIKLCFGCPTNTPALFERRLQAIGEVNGKYGQAEETLQKFSYSHPNWNIALMASCLTQMQSHFYPTTIILLHIEGQNFLNWLMLLIIERPVFWDGGVGGGYSNIWTPNGRESNEGLIKKGYLKKLFPEHYQMQLKDHSFVLFLFQFFPAVVIHAINEIL